MKRIVSRHRFATSAAVVMIALGASGILFTSHSAHAFTLLTSAIIYDPVSLFQNQSLHVHAFNNTGSAPFGTFVTCKPTSAFLGTTATSAAVVLNPGEGFDEIFLFSAFAPTQPRIPITCTILVVGVPPTTPVPLDFSGRLLTSVEVIDDPTGKQMEILGSRHILISPTPTTPPTFCLFCN